MTSTSSDHLVRHLSLRQLQILETVVRLGGHTRAAGALHLTQPTVSMQIKKLEEALGVPLLERVGRQIHPTPAGREVYAAARDILQRLAQLDDGLAELQGKVKGELRIAAVTTAKYFLPHLLSAFVDRYPEVLPRLGVTNRARILERIRAGEDDLYIMGRVPEGLEVEAEAFLPNDLVVVAPAGHPLAGGRAIPLERLAKERILLREPGSGTRQAVERLFAERGLPLEPYMVLGDSGAVKQAVMAGLGVSVISRHNVRLELAAGSLCVLDVSGFPLERRWYMVHPARSHLSLAARTFREFLLEEGPGLLETLQGGGSWLPPSS